MNERARIRPEVQDAVLLKCGRRCAMCAGLHADYDVKAGQLAHIDRDRARAEEDDLAFLCLAHHDAYDSKPSQSKGWQPGELRAYKASLEAAVADDPSLQSHESSERLRESVSHDRRMFVAADRQMTETQLDNFLYVLGSDDSYTDAAIRPIDRFLAHGARVENHFLHPEIQEACRLVAEALKDLMRFLAAQFFVYPRNQVGDDLRHCLKPNWNVDRDGDGSAESMRRYDELGQHLEALIRAVRGAHDNYRRAVKRHLMI